jgi:hypothetical protein
MHSKQSLIGEGRKHKCNRVQNTPTGCARQAGVRARRAGAEETRGQKDEPIELE